MSLKNKVALVTGASRGIGKAVAIELAKAGADLILAARTVSGQGEYSGTIEETAALVRAQGVNAFAIQCDLSDLRDTKKMAKTALERLGHVDILINNAFYKNDQHYSPFLQLRMETWQNAINANFMAPVVLCQTLLPRMAERKQGIIINLTTLHAWSPTPLGGLPGKGGAAAVYDATKGALHRMSLALSKEARAMGIPLILVDPGYTATERVLKDSARLGGYDPSLAHGVDIPARTIRYLCECPNPMYFAGKNVIAAEFVQEHNLV
ncbi:MAG TPA: SDR family oxidoreductase [Candidatus Binataceae bacterium]|jgi:NAD(P)-dependent dehydrogenase (short-subunit alcohol dehydrogenase family)|nr:SDR family oxidoreductase [Candidatus Binataceae bacterium]